MNNTQDGKANVVCPPPLVNDVIAILTANKSTQNMSEELLQEGIAAGELWKGA
jgi:hypothetical protein